MKKSIELIKFKHILLFLIVFFSAITLQAQKKYKAYEDYIELFKGIAIGQMVKYKIPASITLSQGLLESGAGKSELTTKSNNHFGIKCHKDWKGESVKANDDLPNECFRKYKKAEESYEDHSRFLVDKSRYKFLFELNITDYKGWAKGLQKAGYATDIAYANKLIKIIEDYELYELDKPHKEEKKTDKDKQNKKEKEKERKTKTNKNKEKAKTSDQNKRIYKHIPYKTGGLVYIEAKKGDTFESLSDEFGFTVKDLCKFNEVPEDFPIQPGDKIYFQKKKSKADKPYYEHVVQIGESMHSISQLYGIKVGNLVKMNKLNSEYIPTEGDVLRLR